MKVQKRSKFQIYCDILLYLRNELRADHKLTPTRIAHQTNVPYDRFQEYLHNLIEIGLVVHEKETLTVTHKGLEYIEEFGKTIKLLK
jgi:predicted transcriptional regulator